MVVTEPAVEKAVQVERVRRHLIDVGPVTFNEKKVSTATPTLICGAGAVPDFVALLDNGQMDLRHHAADKGTKEEKKLKRMNCVTYELNRVSAKMKELYRSRPSNAGSMSTLCQSADQRALSSVDVNTSSGTSSGLNIHVGHKYTSLGFSDMAFREWRIRLVTENDDRRLTGD